MGNDPISKPGKTPSRPGTDAPTMTAPGRETEDDEPLELARGASVDRYTILDRLGSGGMGEVYAAYDGKLDRKVALKLLLHGGKEYESRLVREAQAMARLSHPNVVGVFDTGMVGSRLFLAMEFVQGRTLRAWRRERPRSFDEVLGVFLEAGRGLAAAHAAGLVHRDFKPDNVLVSEAGQVKVTDFGVVRAADEAPADAGVRELARRLSSRPPPPGLLEALPDVAIPRSAKTPAIPSSAHTPDVPLPTPPTPPTPTSRGAAESLLSQPVTELGTMVGTPGYMAPEQYLCTTVDARTDQFAFSAALYESLYEQKPFAGKGMVELAEATVLGRPRPPPKNTSVPARVHRVLLRGLSTEQAARYPSMQALLDDLLRDPAKRRRNVAVGALGALATVALLAWTQRAATARQGRLCSGAEAAASEVWNDDVRGGIERSLLATGVPYAADTWARTRAQIDGYMGRWATAHRQTCEATRVDGSQSEQVMTVRMACLEQRRQGVRALTQVLSNADRDVAAKALQASLELADLGACKNVTTLTAAPQEPADPALRSELARVRTDLQTLRAKVEGGKYKDAAAQAGPLVERARKVGYAPLTAEVLLWSGSAKLESGAQKEDVLAEWTEAVFQADVGRDDATRALAATYLMRRVPAAGRFTEAEQWSKVADAALKRAGDEGLGRARWLEARGWLTDGQGKYKESAEYRTEALEVARRSGGDMRLVAEIERGLAAERARLGEVAEATRLVGEADDTLVRVLGDNHPARIPFLHSRAFVAGASSPRDGAKYERAALALAEQVAPTYSLVPTMYNNVCSYDTDLGEFEDARVACEQSIARARQMWGDEAAILCNAYTGLGQALNGLHRHDEAIVEFKLAIALQEKLGTTRNTNYVDALKGLGLAELASGKTRDAVEHLEKAVTLASGLEDKAADTQRNVAEARFGLARALWETGTRTARVSELAHAAEDGYRGIAKEDLVREVAAWRLAHQVP
jgi:serine/threonine protein kinase/tetratricopeptide (TPR) repeat protein